MKHLSYRQFKNIFGDLGVTAWVKFNWLSNGLPDGTYNGITKVTLKSNNFEWVKHNEAGIFYTIEKPAIPAATRGTLWGYGFSNYPLYSRDAVPNSPENVAVSVSQAGDFTIKMKDTSTLDEFKKKLDALNIAIYYYNKNEWGGAIITGVSILDGGDHIYYQNKSGVEARNGLRDVQGVFSYEGNYSNVIEMNEQMKDLGIAGNANYGPSFLFRDLSINTITEFQNKYIPRAVVYKL